MSTLKKIVYGVIIVLCLGSLSVTSYLFTDAFNNRGETSSINEDNDTLLELLDSNDLDTLQSDADAKNTRVGELSKVLEIKNTKLEPVLNDIRSQIADNRENDLAVDLYFERIAAAQNAIADPAVTETSINDAITELEDTLSALRKDYNDAMFLERRLREQTLEAERQRQDLQRQLDAERENVRRERERADREREERETPSTTPSAPPRSGTP